MLIGSIGVQLKLCAILSESEEEVCCSDNSSEREAIEPLSNRSSEISADDLRIYKSLEITAAIFDDFLCVNPKTCKEGYTNSLKLRAKLKEGYYVFNHGQKFSISIINIFAKKLKEVHEGRKYTNYEVLRHDVFLRS